MYEWIVGSRFMERRYRILFVAGFWWPEIFFKLQSTKFFLIKILPLVPSSSNVKFFRFSVFVYLGSDLMPRFFSSSHICFLWADGVLVLFREREHWRELCGQLKLEFHPPASCSWSSNLTTSPRGMGGKTQNRRRRHLSELLWKKRRQNNTCARCSENKCPVSDAPKSRRAGNLKSPHGESLERWNTHLCFL